MKYFKDDINDIVAQLKIIAKEEMLSRFYSIESTDVFEKSSPLDLVTVADIESEKKIFDFLAQLYPSAVLIGEEMCEDNPSLLDRLSQDEFCILVDPLDGTINFAAGLPLFGIIISFIQEGETIAGIIYDPIKDEVVYGIKGAGSWIKTQNAPAKRLSVSEKIAVKDMSIGLSWGHLPIDLKNTLTRNLYKFKNGFHFRTAAHEYSLVSAGKVDVLCYYRTKPWDHAAGVLIHSEAGGYSAQFDGERYSPSTVAQGLLIAPSETCWRSVKQALFESYDE